MISRTHLLLTAATLALAVGATVAVAMNGGTTITSPQDTGMVFLDFKNVIVYGAGSESGLHVECSGTLLSPTWVLTARHCVDPASAEFDFGATMTGSPWGRATALAATWDPVGDRFALAGSIPDGATPGLRHPALWAFDRTSAAPASFGDASHGSAPQLTGVGDAVLAAIATVSGGYVAAGTADVGGVERMLVLRFDRDGHLLTSPYPAPASTASVGFAPAPAGRARAVAVDPATGDVIVVGSRLDAAGVERWAAARWSATGVARPAYAYLDGAPRLGTLRDVVVTNGQVVVLGELAAGTAGLGPPVVAVLGDAAPGAIVTNLGWSPGDQARALAADGAGRVLVVGHGGARDRLLATRFAVPSLVRDATYGVSGTASRVYETQLHHLEAVDAGIDRLDGLVVAVREVLSNGSSAFSVARFTAAGLPDPAFGQGGLLLHRERDVAPAATALALAPDHVLIVGNTSEPRPAATLFNLTQDHVPVAWRARLAGASVSIARAVRNPDASLDVALVELTAPIASPSAVRFGGFLDPGELTPEQQVVCYGYGATPTLSRGAFLFAGVRERSLRMVARCAADGTCESEIEGGDSGGACFVEATTAGTSWRMIGVTSRIALDVEQGWELGNQRFYVERGDAAAAWIETTTGLDVTP